MNMLAAQTEMSEKINPDLLAGEWQAEWIGPNSGSGQEPGVWHFRKSFEMDELPEEFIIHVSADNRYRLFVNGESVSFGPARGDLMHWRFETLDVAKYLKSGKNTVAAVVWNFAEHRPEAQFTHRTAFILQGNDQLESAINTNESWKVLKNEAYSLLPVDRKSLGWYYIVVGPGELVDAEKYPWGWQDPNYDDSDWKSARAIRRPVQHWGKQHGSYDGWKLVPRQIPLMEESPQRIPKIARASGVQIHDGFLKNETPLDIPPNTNATLLLDQTFLTTAYPVLTTSGGKDAKIKLTYAEALFEKDDPRKKSHRDHLEGMEIRGYSDMILPDGGENRRFQSLWWRTFRYLQLDITTKDHALKIHDLYGIFTAYPFEQRASFTSSDSSLEKIWQVGWRTARLCAGETYFDCPYYEQLQYVGDTRIQALISLYNAGDDRLMRRAIQDFADSQMPDGLTQSRYPVHGTQFIPPYSLLWIAMVYDYWMHRDDAAFVQSHLRGVRGVVDWYAQYIDETGMVGAVPWWNFIDWAWDRGVPPGADEGGSSIVALQFAYVLQYAAKMSEAFNRPSEALYYRKLFDTLTKAVYKNCWDEKRGLLADTPEKTSFSQHPNVLGVLVGLFQPEQEKRVMERVLADGELTQCTFYFKFYLFNALQKAGMAKRYLEQLEPWRDMLKLGLTTFAEEPEPTRSDCHAWSASPNYHLLALICGVRPLEPGFRSVLVQPELGELQFIEAKMPHPQGEITVKLRRSENGGITGEIVLPNGASGEYDWEGQRRLLKAGINVLDNF